MEHCFVVLWNKALIAYLRRMLQAFAWKFSEKSRKSSVSVLCLRTQIWTRVLRNVMQGVYNYIAAFGIIVIPKWNVVHFCLIWILAIVKSSIAAWTLRCNVYTEQTCGKQKTTWKCLLVTQTYVELQLFKLTAQSVLSVINCAQIQLVK
jgi:hypothetical protein